MMGWLMAQNLHLLQTVSVICALCSVVDHFLDFGIGAGLLHVSVFVATSYAVVCL